MRPKTGKCKKCSRRTQGKNADEFLCRKCHQKEDYETLTTRLNNINKFDLGWFVGLIEGEGCFYCKESNCKISSGQVCYPLGGFALMSTDLDVMERFAGLLGTEAKGPYYEKDKKERKVVWSVQVTGNKAIAIMKFLRPYLGKRRQEQVDKALDWQNRGKFEVANGT